MPVEEVRTRLAVAVIPKAPVAAQALAVAATRPKAVVDDRARLTGPRTLTQVVSLVRLQPATSEC